MTQNEIEFFLREETKNCFSDIWYINISQKISNKFNDTDNNFGYVYFVRVKNSNKVKIGSAKDIINRIYSFKTTLLNEIILDGFIYCKDFREKETLLHKKLYEKLLSFEWFILSELESKNIIEEFGGIFTKSNINKKLVISDGVILLDEKIINNKLLINEQEFEKYKFLYETIKAKIEEYFISDDKIKLFFIAPKDIIEFFINDDKVTNKDIIRAMAISDFIPKPKMKRYKFNNVIKVGRVYALYRKDFISDNNIQSNVQVSNSNLQDMPVDNLNQNQDKVIVAE